MAKVETLPRSIQVQFLVLDWFQRLPLGIDGSINKTVWQATALVSPRFQYFGGHGRKLRIQRERIKQMVEMSYAGSQHVNVMISCLIHFQNVSDNVHPLSPLSSSLPTNGET